MEICLSNFCKMIQSNAKSSDMFILTIVREVKDTMLQHYVCFFSSDLV